MSDNFDYSSPSPRSSSSSRSPSHLPVSPSHSSNYWTKKLMKLEESDTLRWGHSGYKEHHPDEFMSSSDSEVKVRRKGKKKKSGTLSKKAKHRDKLSEDCKRKRHKERHKERHKDELSAKRKRRTRVHSPRVHSPRERSSESEKEQHKPKLKQEKHKEQELSRRKRRRACSPPEGSSEGEGEGSSSCNKRTNREQHKSKLKQ